jgi:hypothetical protein
MRDLNKRVKGVWSQGGVFRAFASGKIIAKSGTDRRLLAAVHLANR